MPEGEFTKSPIWLRSAKGSSFQVETDDETIEMDKKPADSEADDGGGEGDLVRVSNPSPGVSARLRLAGETIGTFQGEGLDSSSIEGMSKWVEGNRSADQLSLRFDAKEILGTELRQLAWLAERKNLTIEIRLRHDG